MAQKNNLKYILLGLLNEQSLTGYDLTKAFDSDIGEFWSANHSQIYPLLKKLELDGLIAHELVTTGEKLEKKLYSITSTGVDELTTWLHTPTPDLNANKDEFILKLYFIDQKSDPLLRPMLTEQLTLHTNKYLHLQTQMKNKFNNQMPSSNNYGHFLILEHAILREQEYKNWLEKVIDNLD